MQSPETDLELEIDRLYQPIQSDDRISVKRSELDLSPSPKGCTGDGWDPWKKKGKEYHDFLLSYDFGPASKYSMYEHVPHYREKKEEDL